MPALLVLGAFALFGWHFVNAQAEDATPNDNMSPEDFRARFHAAFTRAQTHSVPEKVALSVAIHESGYGTGKGFRHSNNLFSIHAEAFTGRATAFWDGKRTYTTGGDEVLRVYNRWEDSIGDFCLGLATRPYLHTAYALAVSGNVNEFFVAFGNSGYVAGPTQPIYASRLASIYGGLA